MIGSRIAHYMVGEKLGEGGMGEVYQATDSRLGRQVALKLLPVELASDPERMGRFEREAQVLAALSHPNIGAIFGIEDVGETKALVLELIEGPTLAELIARGPLPVGQVIDLALQIAKALEAAHEKGIIHRDLKPANIKVSPEGQVKVLDFGLAKAVTPDPEQSMDPTHSPTLTMAATQAGIILGTAGYMSPEQASGQAVDKRSDIWSFGVVLFEMLSAQRLFQGQTLPHTLAAVLQSEIDLDRLPATIPPRLRRLLDRCLVRDPTARLRDIGDARLELMATEEDPPEVVPPPAFPSRLSWVVAVAALLLGLLAGAMWSGAPPNLPLRKSSLPLSQTETSWWASPALSPDGNRIAYYNDGYLWVRDLQRFEARSLGAASDRVIPFWSPDSRFIAFLEDDKIWKVDINQGEPIFVADWPHPTIGAGWGDGDEIVISQWRGGLYRVSADGGTPRLWVDVTEGAVDYHSPFFLPGGKTLLAVVHPVPGAKGGIVAFQDDEMHPVEIPLVPGSGISYSAGHLLIADRDHDRIWAAPFSPDSLEATGDPFLVGPGTMPSGTQDGNLAYFFGQPGDSSAQLVWVDREGAVVGTVGETAPRLHSPSLSPDDRRVAVVFPADNYSGELWVLDTNRAGARFQLTRDAQETPTGAGTQTEYGSGGYPSWSPDGKQLVFSDGRIPPSLVLIASSGGTPTTLVEGLQGRFTPDGSQIVFLHQTVRGDDLLGVVDVEAGTPSRTLFDDPTDKLWQALSPDGRYLAFTAGRDDEWEVYVRAFPDGRARLQVSTGGRAGRVEWGPDGDRVFYVQEGVMMEALLRLGPEPEVLETDRLFAPTDLQIDPQAGWDVSSDGRRFLMVRHRSSGGNREIRVVQNWPSEFADRQQ